MKTLGNIIWHIPFLGFINATIVYLIGLLLTATVIAAPIGLGLMEFGKFLYWPFGNIMVSHNNINEKQNHTWKTYSIIIRVLYFPLGLVLATFAIFEIIGSFMTIIGIPVALVVAKSLGTYLNPVNKKCVSSTYNEDIKSVNLSHSS